MAAVQVTSAANTRLGGASPPNGAFAKTAAGRLWLLVSNQTSSRWELWYSDDNGTSWAENTAARVTTSFSISDQYAFVIDADGHAHWWNQTANAYRRMANISTGTSWSSPFTTSATAAAASKPSIVAHPEGTGWKVHLGHAFATSLLGEYQHTTYLTRLNITSGGTVTADVTDSIISQTSSPHPTSLNGSAPILDFHHTGDGKTVAGGTPHLYAIYPFRKTVGSGGGVKFRKATYSAGSWTWGTERLLVATGQENAAALAATFDGTRMVAMYIADSDGTVPFVVERDAADTTTTTRTPPDPSTGTAILTAAVTYATGDADLVLAYATSTAGDTKYVVFDRSAGTWGSWTALDGSNTNASMHAVHGTLGANVDLAWHRTGTVNVYASHLVLNSAPTAATWAAPTDNTAADVNAALTLDWTFTDPDAGDVQSSYALRRQIGAGSYSYWNAGTSSWQGSEVQNGSSTTAVTLASGWGAGSDANHAYAVKTWDAAGTVGVYSAVVTVVPSVKVNPTLTTPAAAATVGTANLTAAWTVTEQTAYRLKLYDAAGTTTLWDSGWVTANVATASAAIAYALANGTSYKAGIQTRNNEGLASTEAINSFAVSYTPPATPTLAATANTPAGAITVAITNPTPTGSQPAITGNDLYVRVAAGGTADGERPVAGDGVRIATGLASGASYVDRAAASGVTYQYRARALGVNGTSSDSAWTA